MGGEKQAQMESEWYTIAVQNSLRRQPYPDSVKVKGLGLPTCTAMYLDTDTRFSAVSTSAEASPSLRPLPLMRAFCFSF